MTKREWQNVAKTTPAIIIISFYWWATATDFQWQGDSVDMWYASLMALGAVIAILGLVVAAPIAMIFWLKERRRQHKTK